MWEEQHIWANILKRAQLMEHTSTTKQKDLEE